MSSRMPLGSINSKLDERRDRKRSEDSLNEYSHNDDCWVGEEFPKHRRIRYRLIALAAAIPIAQLLRLLLR